MSSLDYSKIDFGIRDLVRLFNDKGFKTKNCCAGHMTVNRNNSIVPLPAYIEFDESVKEEQIHKLFSAIHYQDNNRIINDFSIDKYFRELNFGQGDIISRWRIYFPRINAKSRYMESFRLKEECFLALEKALKSMD